MIRHLDRARFAVPSSSGGEPYVVDLEENRGNGVCTCRDFVTRRQQNWDKTKSIVEYEPKNAASTRCKHINAILLHLGTTLAQRLCAQR